MLQGRFANTNSGLWHFWGSFAIKRMLPDAAGQMTSGAMVSPALHSVTVCSSKVQISLRECHTPIYTLVHLVNNITSQTSFFTFTITLMTQMLYHSYKKHRDMPARRTQDVPTETNDQIQYWQSSAALPHHNPWGCRHKAVSCTAGSHAVSPIIIERNRKNTVHSQ